MRLALLGLLLTACFSKVTENSFYFSNAQWTLIDTFHADYANSSLTIASVVMVPEFPETVQASHSITQHTQQIVKKIVCSRTGVCCESKVSTGSMHLTALKTKQPEHHTHNIPSQVLALYHDVEQEDAMNKESNFGFSTVYGATSSCQDKLSKAAKIISLAELASDSALSGLTERTYYFLTAAPRKWHLVLANCKINGYEGRGPEGAGVRNLKITWTNGGPETGRFVTQFSMDEHGIFEMMIVSLIVLLGLIGVCTALYCRLRKDETDLAHHVLLVILVAMSIQVTSSPLL
jgi:hypothetical protein